MHKLYFKIVNFVFWVIELPRRRRILDYPEDDLLLLSAIEAAELIRRQEITSESLIQAYILRITHINRFLNAVVIQNFDDAIEEGRQVDSYIQHIDKDSDEYKILPHKKPFLGVPFTLKDSMSVEGLVCTVGIPSRRNTVAEEDAEVVQKMRDAGAIVLAVTNVPEAIMWCESANTIYGRTNNPYNIRRTCGGSSGGEGALIAGAGSVIGLGSDVGGSIRIPAAFNGVFGLKPTSGIVSLKGSFPVVEGEDYRSLMWCIGPLCRYAKDLKPMLQVLAGDKAESLLHLHNPVNFRNIRIFYMEEINSLFVEPLHED
uniref:Amidase domain-containing protein n=1 Tax=Acrobeloides nanus TaxID=290746 RepID=A0A914CQP3_9BILA